MVARTEWKTGGLRPKSICGNGSGIGMGNCAEARSVEADNSYKSKHRKFKNDPAAKSFHDFLPRFFGHL